VIWPRIVLLIGLSLGAVRVGGDAVALIGVGDSWRFQAASDAASESWRQVDFDDSSWRAGESGFGLSTWGENTMFHGMLRGSGAVQFRKTFVVDDPGSVRSLTFRCDWQGGFVAWLNGVEILRRNLPGIPDTPLPLETPASYRPAGAAEDIPVPDPGQRLQRGTNVLAIQCHPYALGWFDVVLVPELLANFSRGPYLQQVLQERATVLWRTPESLPGEVEYGETPALGATASPDGGPSGALEAVIRGLKPGTRYWYRVRSGPGGASVVSPTYSFRTLPASGDLDFAVLGDSGAGTAAQFGVARRITEASPDLLLHLGDIVYPSFSLGRTDTRLLGVYRSLLRSTPYFFAWGNHDLYGGTEAFLSALRAPTNNTPPEHHRSAGTIPEFYYSFDAGDAHFAVLYWPDSGQYSMPPGCPQWRWLEADLAASDKTWKFLALHHPVNTSGGHRFDDRNQNGILDRLEVAGSLLPLAEQYGVQMIFSGHDHNYERFHPAGSTHLLVSGGGGILLYGMTEPDPASAVFESRWHYASIRLRGDLLRLVAVDWEGRVFDALEFRRTDRSSGDADGDGLSLEAEQWLGTRPDRPDTDGDGLPDGWEFLRGSPPTQRDLSEPERRLQPLLAAPMDRPQPELAAVRDPSGGVLLRWLAVPGGRIVLEQAPSVEGPWNTVLPGANVTVRPEAQQAELIASGDQRYFRARRVPVP